MNSYEDPTFSEICDKARRIDDLEKENVRLKTGLEMVLWEEKHLNENKGAATFTTENTVLLMAEHARAALAPVQYDFCPTCGTATGSDTSDGAENDSYEHYKKKKEAWGEYLDGMKPAGDDK